MNKKAVISIIVVVVIIVAVVALSSSQDSQPQPAPQSNSQSTLQQPVSGEVKSFTMMARQWEFEPSTITVSQGDRVNLTITSVDVAHGIGIPEFGVSSVLSPGQTTEVEFVADRAGTFSFFCNVSCGVGHGNMRGTLIVQ